MRKSFVVVILTFFLVLTLNVNAYAGPRSGYGDPVCEYQSTLGPKIESYSKTWNTKEKLMQVYRELTKNYVSTEISKLKYIYLYPDIEEGVSGYYSADVITKSDGTYSMGDNSYIVILGCDESSSLSSISKTLSHEYGHHFTTYYLVTYEKLYGRGWINSRYAKIRGLNNLSQVKNYSSVSGSSKWDIAEIAAWDYVQLFGAASNKTSVDYKDVQERADYGYSQINYLSSNSYPQENMDLPLATHVPGLYDYWANMAGGASARPNSYYTSTLTVAKKFLVQGKNNLYKLTWDSMAGGNYEYTIVMHPTNNSSNITPIKTSKTGEQNIAYIGSYAGARTLIENYRGVYTVRIFIKDANGFTYEGKCAYINFDENLTPVSNYSTIFKDLLKNHWAYDYIISLNSANIINGYEDGTFRPEGTITRKEFIALLMRVSNLSLTKYKKLSDDWFTREGYLAAAKAYSIITTSDYGANYSKLNLNGKITRQEMSVMIGRVLLSNKFTVGVNEDYTSHFKDFNAKNYKTEINLVVKNDILNGYPDGTFKGSNNASRAEAAKMIYKTYKLLK
ncbi:MAG: S-layer homology domain-containing protein [archaeon]|nr:S-layer homology domain-containing protein [archaeon]